MEDDDDDVLNEYLNEHFRIYDDVPVVCGEYGPVLVVKGPLAGTIGEYDDDDRRKGVVIPYAGGPLEVAVRLSREKPAYYHLVPYRYMRRLDVGALSRYIDRLREWDKRVEDSARSEPPPDP